MKKSKYTQVGYYLPVGESEEKMNEHIQKKAEEFNTATFASDKKNAGHTDKRISL